MPAGRITEGRLYQGGTLQEGVSVAKTLVEMAAEIVGVQASHTKMSAEEMAQALERVFDALRRAREIEEGAGPVAPEGVERRQRSVFRNKVICLECRESFKQLTNRHLSKHGLNKRTYREKHGIPPSQKLVAASVSERRSQLAKERGLGQRLAEARRAGRPKKG
jgi:predicted transcriptional regulator